MYPFVTYNVWVKMGIIYTNSQRYNHFFLKKNHDSKSSSQIDQRRKGSTLGKKLHFLIIFYMYICLYKLGIRMIRKLTGKCKWDRHFRDLCLFKTLLLLREFSRVQWSSDSYKRISEWNFQNYNINYDFIINFVKANAIIFT